MSGEYSESTVQDAAGEISRLEKERGSAVPYNQIYLNADGREPARESVDAAQLRGLEHLDGYLARANRQPQNEDNSVGLMVDAAKASPARICSKPLIHRQHRATGY